MGAGFLLVKSSLPEEDDGGKWYEFKFSEVNDFLDEFEYESHPLSFGILLVKRSLLSEDDDEKWYEFKFSEVNDLLDEITNESQLAAGIFGDQRDFCLWRPCVLDETELSPPEDRRKKWELRFSSGIRALLDEVLDESLPPEKPLCETWIISLSMLYTNGVHAEISLSVPGERFLVAGG